MPILTKYALSLFILVLWSAPAAAVLSGPLTLSFEPIQAQRTIIHSDLEEALDLYLNLVDDEEREAELTRILQEVGASEYPSTYMRAQSYQFFEFLRLQELEQAEELLVELLPFAEQHPFADVVIEYYVNWLELRQFQQQTSEMLAIAEQLTMILDQVQNPRIGYYTNIVLLGVFSSNGQYQRALEHGLQSLEWLSLTTDNRRRTRRVALTGQITQVHLQLRNYDLAMDLTVQAIQEAEEGELYGFLPGLYLRKGYIEGVLGQTESSIASHRRAIEWAEQMEWPGVIFTSLNNIASSYIELENYDRAREILLETYELLEAHDALGDDVAIAHVVLFNLGYIAVMTDDFSGIEAIRKHTDALRNLSEPGEFYEHLEFAARAYERAGMYQAQAQTLLEQRNLRDTISQTEREDALRELEVRYQAQDRLQQIELLQQRNDLQEQIIENKQLQQQIFILFGVVVVMGLFLLAFLYRAARRANLRLKVANKQLEFHSRRDPLTALLNRRALQDHMTHRAKNERRHSNPEHPDGLVLLDVDYFKRINDTHGHAAGDTVLKALSERLTNLARSSDLVVRWGGEEFLLYLPGMAEAKLPEFTSRVLQVIGEKPVIHEGKEIPVTATAGFIHLPFAGIDESVLGWERALQIADMALYIGKVHGRNRAYGLRGLNKPYDDIKDQLEHDLNAAIEEGVVDYVLIEGPTQKRDSES
ncbi:tetratricopeptide repeat-containing diguanylate cyclase [Aliidiomarina haloalkalitolerans]|uniref:diguanylate cyclase n=1 Tax=Aliidiomarina haloalkalitolerans TaxID=859059 RepID=A0A432VV77_9GAMM|nr:tetratricopeptide repeat-containing diguanylate cyclase [Aliidiomarina haloalkalitolerans]RUO20288.1 GGDEF domain-containing protein [Aliidiomarina haloalkalitolerans]